MDCFLCWQLLHFFLHGGRNHDIFTVVVKMLTLKVKAKPF